MFDVSSYDVGPRHHGGHGGALGHHVHDADAQLVQQGVVVGVTEVYHGEYFVLPFRVLPTQNILFIEVSMNDTFFQLILTVPNELMTKIIL